MLKTLTWHLAESRSIKAVNMLSIGFITHLGILPNIWAPSLHRNCRCHPFCCTPCKMYHVQNRHKIFRFGLEFRPADIWMVRCSESKDLTYASALDARTQFYSEMLLLTSSSLEIVGLMQGSCHFVREDCITLSPPKKQQLANVHHRALITQWIGLIVLVLHNHNCSPFLLSLWISPARMRSFMLVCWSGSLLLGSLPPPT